MKVRKIRFMALDRAAMGNSFEVVVITVIASIIEKRRRAKKSS